MLTLEAQKQIKHDEKLTRNKKGVFFFLHSGVSMEESRASKRSRVYISFSGVPRIVQ